MPGSLWDDPFGEEEPENKKTRIFPLNQQARPVDVSLIRERQKKLLLYIDQLREAAIEVMMRYDPLTLTISEREMLTVVDYRVPDTPHLLQRYSRCITDYAIVVPVDLHNSDFIIDKFAPPKRVEEIKGQRNLSALLRLENIARENIPEMVRIIHPSLLKFLAFWVRKIEGPINRVYYNERPVNPCYNSVQVSEYRH